jgi:hypothetical protein
MAGSAQRMAEEAVRTALEDMIRRSGEGYAAISRMIGRNPAYIQQFIRRGVPRRLSEDDRRVLAGHFGVPESLLGAPPHRDRAAGPTGRPAQPAGVRLDRIGRGGTVAQDILLDGTLALALATDPGRLRAHVLEGDAMAPTLLSGDLLIVDTGAASPMRDGLYLIAGEGGPFVRRVTVNPAGGAVTLLADNAGYPSWEDLAADRIEPLGRVIWFGRRLA